jgi:protocatechuate 3,4-dioxygenase beta subunit
MNPAKVRFFSVLAILAAVAMPSIARAGTTGVVSGRVYDEIGHPLSGATVSVVMLKDRGEFTSELNVKSHESFSRKTDSQGFFVYPSLNPGFYQIEPSMSGRAPDCSPRVIVDADQTTYVNLSMVSRETLVDCAGRMFIYPITERLPLQTNTW